MTPVERRIWNEIAECLELECVNIVSYIYDFVDDEECKGFTLKSCNGIVTISTIGRKIGRRQERILELELNGQMPERWKYLPLDQPEKETN
jgi:hypothetical protein